MGFSRLRRRLGHAAVVDARDEDIARGADDLAVLSEVRGAARSGLGGCAGGGEHDTIGALLFTPKVVPPQQVPFICQVQLELASHSSSAASVMSHGPHRAPPSHDVAASMRCATEKSASGMPEPVLTKTGTWWSTPASTVFTGPSLAASTEVSAQTVRPAPHAPVQQSTSESGPPIATPARTLARSITSERS
jgi:hypothetical protein